MNFSIFGREPVRWVGIIVTVVAAVVSALLGEGVISDVVAGRVSDLTTNLSGILLLLLPLITTEIARRGATSRSEPSLPEGTVVTVVTPANEPDRVVIV